MFGPVAPSRARGLKHGQQATGAFDVLVAPSRARGLKLLCAGGGCVRLCRAFTGAWIETLSQPTKTALRRVAPSRARGLKLR